MVTGPTAIPDTRPVDETVATAVLELAHVTTRPLSALPLASFGIAVSCTVWPMTTPAVGGVISTAATAGTVTVTGAVACFPSLAAVIAAIPGDSAATSAD